MGGPAKGGKPSNEPPAARVRADGTLSFNLDWLNDLHRFVDEVPPGRGYATAQDVVRAGVRVIYDREGWDPVRGFQARDEAWRDPMARSARNRKRDS